MGDTTEDEKTYRLNSQVSLSDTLYFNKSFSSTEAFSKFWNYLLGVQATEVFMKRIPLDAPTHKVDTIEVEIDRDTGL